MTATTIETQVAAGLTRITGETRPELLLAASLVTRATRRGNVCLDLASASSYLEEDEVSTLILPPTKAWLDLLSSPSKLIGPPDHRDTPLVLDEGRLYLRRYFTYEKRLADHLGMRIGHVEPTVDGKLLKQGLDRLFGRPANDERDLQRLAALVAVLRGFCIISGGPGTGKTTTVTKILALLQEQSIALRKNKLHIMLVAPTGKAAARLRESIEKALASLDCTPQIKSLIPTDATTIHRRLSPIAGSATRFRHNAENPLACDVMLVDEASMVDLPLMTRLLDALPRQARLILLGDRNQLASVETGAVLGDLCGRAIEPSFSAAFADRIEALTGERVQRAPASAPNPPIADCVVQLEKSWRFGENSGIRHLALAVNAGDADEAIRLLESKDFDDIALRPGQSEDAKLNIELRMSAVEGYRPYLAERDPVAAARAFNRYRALCAHRRGPFGVESLNALIEQALDQERLLSANAQWYAHRPVLVTENDYAVNLFNGDVGLALPTRVDDRAGEGDEEMRVHFVSADGKDRALAPSRLPRHETVFAMTVHKAQGSEFDRVAFVLPSEATAVLTRELVYTAVTRTMKSLSVHSTTEILRAALSRDVRRASGLGVRLWQPREDR